MTQDFRPQMGQLNDPDGPISPERMVAYSQTLLSLAIARLSTLLAGYEDQPIGAAKELAEEFRALRKAVEIAYHERAQLQKLARESGGGGTGGALDLDAARSEIARRLDRLRAAECGSGLSGGAE
ncbi:MAG: hypothetical protein ACK4HW_04830 [Roseinatronobacter sp.]